MNLNQLNSIGRGATFPIQLTHLEDGDGNPIQVPKIELDEEGNPHPVMTQKKDEEGNPMWNREPGTLSPDDPGDPLMIPVMVDSVSWRPLSSQELIKNNLTSLMVFMLGQRFRQENFGCRIWECLEEPNTQALNFLVYNFIKSAIAAWEPRIKALGTSVIARGSTLTITLRYSIGSTDISELTFDYNLQDSTSYAY